MTRWNESHDDVMDALIGDPNGIGYAVVEEVDGIWWATNGIWICRADRLSDAVEWEEGCWSMVLDGSGPTGQGRTLTRTGGILTGQGIAKFIALDSEANKKIRSIHRCLDHRALYHVDANGNAVALLAQIYNPEKRAFVRLDYLKLIAGPDWNPSVSPTPLSFSQLEKPGTNEAVLVHRNGELLGMICPVKLGV